MARIPLPLVAMTAMCALLAAATVVRANGGGRRCSNSTNEVFLDPGPNCDLRCDALNVPCTKIYVRAPSGCYCREGYARDARDKCIPMDLC